MYRVMYMVGREMLCPNFSAANWQTLQALKARLRRELPEKLGAWLSDRPVRSFVEVPEAADGSVCAGMPARVRVQLTRRVPAATRCNDGPPGLPPGEPGSRAGGKGTSC
jgi:hypothetical protein